MKRNFLQTNKFSTTNENFPNPKILRPLDRTLRSELEAPPRPLAKSSVERVFKFQNATESSPTNFDFFFLETRNCNLTNPSHSYKIALILPLKKRPLAIGPTELQVVSKSSKLRHQTKKQKGET